MILLMPFTLNATGTEQQILSQHDFSSNVRCVQLRTRPCIGVVLGGGGARGSAHIGVLKALEEYRIPIDIIAGTSIGAFVGGLYASGHSVEDIEDLFSTTDWNSGYQDDLVRSAIPNRRKRQLDEYPIHLDLGVSFNDGVKFPRGFLRGQGMKNLVDEMLGAYPVFTTFDELPIAFRAVAADATTGEQVVLDRGDLATALQISMSLPGIVRPIERDGRLLVDGGIANNLPVSVARELGADIIIAVNIGSPIFSQSDLDSGLVILRQLTKFLTQNNVDQQIALLGPMDVYIEPDIEDVGLLSFDKTMTAVEMGYESAKQELEKHPGLRGFLESHDSPELARTKSLQAKNQIRVDTIDLSNDSRLSDDYILHRLNLHEGENYTASDIHQAINRVYGQGTIARINATLDESAGTNHLNFKVEEKEWGPGYMDFKFTFEDDFESFSQYQLGAQYRLTNLTAYGAEWLTRFEFGTDKLLNTRFYWPFSISGFFADLEGFYTRDLSEFNFPSVGSSRVADINWGGKTGIGWNSVDLFDIAAGLFSEDGYLELPAYFANALGDPELDYQRRGVYLNMGMDTLDDASFPKKGWKWSARINRSRDKILNLDTYVNQIDIRLNKVISFGIHSLRGQLRYQGTFTNDSSAIFGSWSMGGFLNLSGNPAEFISGKQVRFASIVYTYELAANNFGAIELPLYLGMSLEAGNAWNDESDVDYGDLIHSNSLFVGWLSPVGPAYFAYGHSDTGEGSFYVFLGVVL